MDGSNSDMPLQEGAWGREDDDPLTYEHEDGDVLKLKDSKHGHGVWFLDEGRDGLRLQFYDDRSDAKSYLKRALGRNIQNLRGEVRQQMKNDGDVTLTKSDVTSAAYPVNGQRAEILARHYDTMSDLRDASDGELLALDGIGQGTVDTLREKLGDDGDDATQDGDGTEGDVDTTVEPSGLDLDDPATEITGVGDTSNLARDTVGEFWEMGCPFHEVSPAWQDDAFRDILGASFFNNTQPDHLIRVFAGYTASYSYDENGEELGNYAEALFGEFDWADVRWAWADHGLTTDFADVAAAEEVLEEQAAIATGDELPYWELDFDPEEDDGLSGLHDASDAEVGHNPESGKAMAVQYPASGIENDPNDVYVPFETVALYSLLFSTDYTDPEQARENVRLVVDTKLADDAKRTRVLSERLDHQNLRYVAIFDHPNADVHGLAEGRMTVRPSDFDLEEPSEWDDWAQQVAKQVEERDEAFRREMEASPKRGSEHLDSLRDEDDHHISPSGRHRADESDPTEREKFEEMMGDVYDPVEDQENPWEGMDVLRSDEPETVYQADLDKTEQATPDEHGVLVGDDGNGFGPEGWEIVEEPDEPPENQPLVDNPSMRADPDWKEYRFPSEIGDFAARSASDRSIVYTNPESPFKIAVNRHQSRDGTFVFRLDHEDETPAQHGEEYESVKGYGKNPNDFFEWFNSLDATHEADPIYLSTTTDSDGIDRKENPEEEIAGYDLVVEDEDMIEWQGTGGGSPPATFSRDGFQTTVQVMNHGGRYGHRWTTRVKWDEGTETKTRTLRQYKYRGMDGAEAAREDNREKAIAKAEQWMRDNPASEPDQDNDGGIYDPTTEFETGDDGYPNAPGDVGPFERHETPPGRYKWATNSGPHVSVHIQKGGLGGTWSGHAVRDGDRIETWNKDYSAEEVLAKAVDFMSSYDPEEEDDTDDHLNDSGFKKTKVSDLDGIGEKTAEKLEPGTTTVAGVADLYRPNSPDPHPDISQEKRETIASEFSEPQKETLFEAIEQYADKKGYDVETDAAVSEFTSESDMDQSPDDTKFSQENNPANDENEALRDELKGRGVNTVVASNVARQFDDVGDVRAALEDADDPTDLPGVGDKSADQIVSAVGTDSTDTGGKQAATDGGTATISTDTEQALQSAKEKDPNQELEGPALKALSEAWSGYKAAAKEGHQAVEETEEWREEYRSEAQEYAAIINDIRAAHGQDPIDFDGVDGIPETHPVHGEITEDTPGVDLSFNWRADPYDPTEEL